MCSTTLRIFAMLAGIDNKFVLAARVEPHDLVDKLLDLLAQQLVDIEMPYDFAAAYSLLYSTNGVGLRYSDPDFMALDKGDPVVMARYFTAAARLDPSKTVAHYFGTSVNERVVHVVLEWTAEAHALFDEKVERTKPLTAAYLAKYPSAMLHKPTPPVVANVHPAPKPSSHSLWTSVSSWFCSTASVNPSPFVGIGAKKIS